MRKNNKKNERKGMYIALAICVVAIGFAAWGTFYSVSNYLDSSDLSFMNEDNSSNSSYSDPDPEPNADNSARYDTESSQPKTEESDVEESEVDGTVDTPKPIDTEEVPETTETNTSLYTLSDEYIMPTKSVTIIQEFSGDKLVYNSTMRDYRVHQGVDISTEIGDEIVAINQGQVKSIYNDLLLGNVVVVEHGDFDVHYCGLDSSFNVNENDIVAQGDVLGTVKDVPFEQGESHLHIEFWVEDNAVDPLSLAIYQD